MTNQANGWHVCRMDLLRCDPTCAVLFHFTINSQSLFQGGCFRQTHFCLTVICHLSFVICRGGVAGVHCCFAPWYFWSGVTLIPFAWIALIARILSADPLGVVKIGST